MTEDNITDTEAEILFLYLLGDKLDDELTALFKGRSQPKLEGFRRGLNEAFNSGAFVVMAGPEHQARTGNDEWTQHPINQRLRALCGADAAMRINELSRTAKMSNYAGLRAGVRSALDRWAL